MHGIAVIVIVIFKQGIHSMLPIQHTIQSTTVHAHVCVAIMIIYTELSCVIVREQYNEACMETS